VNRIERLASKEKIGKSQRSHHITFGHMCRYVRSHHITQLLECVMYVTDAHDLCELKTFLLPALFRVPRGLHQGGGYEHY
jgi:hypothetical protein